MRTPILLAALSFLSAANAQSWYVPDSQANAGNCNVIPFGSTSLTTWGNQRYQTKATVADLGGLPAVITGLAFPPCGSGSVHYDALEVVLDHHPAGAPLNTTFDNNLSPNAVTVLSVTNFEWITTANTWNDLGLQNVFVYNGLDDVVVQVTTANGVLTGSPAGFHSASRQRLYWFGTTGPASPVGTLGSTAAIKMEFSMLMATLGTYGHGCAGANGTPSHALGGSSQLGNTVQIGLANGLPTGAAALVIGFDNSAPAFPFDLGLIGMPGCLQYIDVVSALFVALDAAGAVTVPLPIPSTGGLTGVTLFSQFACVDPNANAVGFTTSNYGRIYIGN